MQNSNCPNCGENREENFDLCWNCGTSFQNTNLTPVKEFEKEDLSNYKIKVGVVEKLNSAGSSLKSIAKTILFFFLANIILIAVVILTGRLNIITYLLLGIGEIIMIISIVLDLNNAGNELLSISSIDSTENNR
jgi:hypothetical protein